MITKGEYKGHATITLTRDEKDRNGFTFGIAKARLILENLDGIKEFIAETEMKAMEEVEKEKVKQE